MCWRTWLAVGCIALAAGSALAASVPSKVAQIDGEKVKVDAKPLPLRLPVEVDCAVYTAERGPDKVLVAAGNFRSNLPHDWYNVTVRVKVYHAFKDANNPKGTIADTAGDAVVVFERPKPGVVERFIAWVKKEDGSYVTPATVGYYAVTTSFERVMAP
ncbi:MAG TPA: hypothetical protein PLE19_04775 [Planctomycetota bacterium]|nr:hypothetical protein [Planctomycetota bacterium]HRR79102.1 hypothetical protein [Planctomycetota bacterium]HRT93165.1 hypothetical protein [Planctomycetota bacterium]